MAAEPLIAIVGQTASGKTALALDIAKRYHGEIICADSRTVYEGMDISTAKPSEAERQDIPHHCLDIVTPDQYFSAADFKRSAEQSIDTIHQRGNVPILVGGSGLFIDAVLYDYSFESKADENLRKELSGKSVIELQAIIQEKGLPMPENERNPRYLIRTIETNGKSGSRSGLRPSTLLVGLKLDKETLHDRIERRVKAMLEDGLIDEVKRNARLYGWGAPGLQEPAYKAFKSYVEGSTAKQQAQTDLIRQHVQFAKRQRTWFARNEDIVWMNNHAEALQKVQEFMSNYLLQ